MKTLLRLLPLFAFLATAVHAASDDIVAAVRAADDARITATKAADAAALGAIYSDELHYAHSNGRVDTKASQIAGITTGNNRYQDFEHKERVFTVAAPNIVLARGRVLVRMVSKAGQKSEMDLNYLAVWRNENGKWRFLAWQSCRNPVPGEAGTAKK